MRNPQGCILFDWGDTLMRNIGGFSGPMKDWPRVEAVAGALELLTVLQPAWTLAVATNAGASGEADIRAALQRVNLEPFIEHVYCFKNIGYLKPALEFFRYILKDVKLAPGSVFMVGDSYETDVLGANRAGLRAVWLNERSPEVRENAMQRTIHALGELQEALNGFA